MRPDATIGSIRSRMVLRSAFQTLRPSITPSDSTRSSARARADGIELLRRADEVDMQAMHRQRQRGRQIVGQRAEIGCQHQHGAPGSSL